MRRTSNLGKNFPANERTIKKLSVLSVAGVVFGSFSIKSRTFLFAVKSVVQLHGVFWCGENSASD